ncbi:arsenate reductase (thioredoxin) [Enterococcus saccharolyticus]|uniref:arsenate reductase (thioredoxin) n=1 Tax=Enterococcus saccharolyticus TaxID=41997 RepID=UPI001E2AB10E|nr:arsenate reductase (thioredoxin) [Enterococcus saccharolyticus]MCD5002401.1 arsenate reductase (thioredoxin) [Enterococcus saccharolyticus]
MKKVYFLCTGNSCRSQIAEGYGKKYLTENGYEVRSAGIETHGLNPRAVKVMAEDGIDITVHTSDLIDPAFFNEADLIITLCGDAKDNCPVIPQTATHIHWGLEDPAKAIGTEEEIMDQFRATREIIKQKIQELI